jgi:hypothetical protein
MALTNNNADYEMHTHFQNDSRKKEIVACSYLLYSVILFYVGRKVMKYFCSYQPKGITHCNKT